MKHTLACLALLLPGSLIAQDNIKTKSETKIIVSDGKETKTYHIGNPGEDLPSFLDDLNLDEQIESQIRAQLDGVQNIAKQWAHNAIVVSPDGHEHEIDLHVMNALPAQEDPLEKLWPQIAKGLERAGVDLQTIDKAFDYVKAYASPDKRHMIGVQCRELDEVLRHQLGLEQGLVVQEVFEDSSAQKAGLEKHDILLQADGVALQSVTDLVDAVQGAGVEQTGVKLALLRAGEKREITVDTQARVLPKAPSMPTGDLFFSNVDPLPVESLKEVIGNLQEELEEAEARQGDDSHGGHEEDNHGDLQ